MSGLRPNRASLVFTWEFSHSIREVLDPSSISPDPTEVVSDAARVMPHDHTALGENDIELLYERILNKTLEVGHNIVPRASN